MPIPRVDRLSPRWLALTRSHDPTRRNRRITLRGAGWPQDADGVRCGVRMASRKRSLKASGATARQPIAQVAVLPPQSPRRASRARSLQKLVPDARLHCSTAGSSPRALHRALVGCWFRGPPETIQTQPSGPTTATRAGQRTTPRDAGAIRGSPWLRTRRPPDGLRRQDLRKWGSGGCNAAPQSPSESCIPLPCQAIPKTHRPRGNRTLHTAFQGILIACQRCRQTREPGQTGTCDLGIASMPAHRTAGAQSHLNARAAPGSAPWRSTDRPPGRPA